MKTFKIAVVGCGGVSDMHFKAYKAHAERVDIVAVCDLDQQRLQHAQAKHGFAAAFPSLQEMIEQADWEVAVVCTPTSVRESVVESLAAAGKHVFVEKPMADSYAEAQRMVAACAQAGVQLAVDQNFRYHYPFNVAKQVTASGDLGQPLSVLHQDLHFRQDSGWRTQCQRHALSVMGVHWFDGFRWMLDCEAKSLVCHTHSSAAIECVGETEAGVHIVFDNEVMISYTQSFSSSVARTETLIIGEAGTLILDYSKSVLFNHGNRQTPAAQWANPYSGERKPESVFECLNQMLTALEQGQEPANSGRDNLNSIALLDAAYTSAAEQRAISFSAGVPQ